MWVRFARADACCRSSTLFNYEQSSARINIECAFGMLKSKFLVFARPLKFNLERTFLIVRVAAKLHNLCIDVGLEAEDACEADAVGNPDPQVAPGSGDHRAAADLRRHLTSGTIDEEGLPTSESPKPAWFPGAARAPRGGTCRARELHTQDIATYGRVRRDPRRAPVL